VWESAGIAPRTFLTSALDASEWDLDALHVECGEGEPTEPSACLEKEMLGYFQKIPNVKAPFLLEFQIFT
jgi:hypothetical protein